jgi:ATP-dependent protease HslVU (ClpYQ), ATPase subunit
MSEMTPREIVNELDQHIIGPRSRQQYCCYRPAYRWSQMRINEELRHEIPPNKHF